MSPTTRVSEMIKASGPPQIAAWRLMLETHADLMERFEVVFRDSHGLSLTEFDTLINMPPDTPIRHRDLVQSLVVTRSALSRLLRRFEERGIVTQTADVDDQRGIRVALTPEGVELREAAAKSNAEVIFSAFSGLTVEEADTLYELVSKIRTDGAGPGA